MLTTRTMPIMRGVDADAPGGEDVVDRLGLAARRSGSVLGPSVDGPLEGHDDRRHRVEQIGVLDPVQRRMGFVGPDRKMVP